MHGCLLIDLIDQFHCIDRYYRSGVSGGIFRLSLDDKKASEEAMAVEMGNPHFACIEGIKLCALKDLLKIAD